MTASNITNKSENLNQSNIELVVTANTVFKAKPIQSNELAEEQKLAVPAGTYELKEYEDKGNHILIELINPLGGKTEWYVFEGHIDLLKLAAYPENTDKPEPKKEGPFKLPGYQSTFYLSEPIISQGNFTWSEATKGGARIPQTKQIVENILAMAHKMEEVRELFGGKAITVTSWYRDPATNRRIGGARNSTHMLGYAVDFNVSGLTPREVQRKLESPWRGGMGYGSSFTHLDMRNYRARWPYGS